MRPTRLLFVCSGNICRSPMAEVLAQHLAEQRGLRVEAASAGTLLLEGREAHAHSIAVCDELGLDLHGFRSQGVSDALLAWADHVVVMALEHTHYLVDHHPEHERKILHLGTFGPGRDIPDPIGRMRFRFRRVRDEIRGSLEVLLSRLPAAHT